MRIMTKAEVNAVEIGSKFIDDISNLLDMEKENGGSTGKERWKLCADFVESVKGRAMVSALCAVFTSEIEFCNIVMGEALDAIKLVKTAPKGSITKTFSDVEYRATLVDALMTLYEFERKMRDVQAMANRKFAEAEGKDYE